MKNFLKLFVVCLIGFSFFSCEEPEKKTNDIDMPGIYEFLTNWSDTNNRLVFNNDGSFNVYFFSDENMWSKPVSLDTGTWSIKGSTLNLKLSYRWQGDKFADENFTVSVKGSEYTLTFHGNAEESKILEALALEGKTLITMTKQKKTNDIDMPGTYVFRDEYDNFEKFVFYNDGSFDYYYKNDDDEWKEWRDNNGELGTWTITINDTMNDSILNLKWNFGWNDSIQKDESYDENFTVSVKGNEYTLITQNSPFSKILGRSFFRGRPLVMIKQP